MNSQAKVVHTHKAIFKRVSNKTLKSIGYKHKSVDETPKSIAPYIQKEKTESCFKKSITNITPSNAANAENKDGFSELKPLLSLTDNHTRYKSNIKKKALDFELFPLLEECKSYFRNAYWGTIEGENKKGKRRAKITQSKALRAISVKGKQINNNEVSPWYENKLLDFKLKKTFIPNYRACPVSIRRMKDNGSASRLDDISKAQNTAYKEKLIYN